MEQLNLFSVCMRLNMLQMDEKFPTFHLSEKEGQHLIFSPLNLARFSFGTEEHMNFD